MSVLTTTEPEEAAFPLSCRETGTSGLFGDVPVLILSEDPQFMPAFWTQFFPASLASGVCENLEYSARRIEGVVDEKPADRGEEEFALRADRSPGTGDRGSGTDDSDASRERAPSRDLWDDNGGIGPGAIILRKTFSIADLTLVQL